MIFSLQRGRKCLRIWKRIKQFAENGGQRAVMLLQTDFVANLYRKPQIKRCLSLFPVLCDEAELWLAAP
jgi:hypothetical protein